jgi:hypothetical protein
MIPLRRRLYQSSPGFSPWQLFSALQGLWAEPNPDTCFTDTAGTTPASTAQAIAKITELSAARSIIQSTASNRPTLQVDANGKYLVRHDATDVLTASLPSINVRRNLLTWSEDFANAGWTKTDVTVIANAALAPDGTATADKLIANSGTTNGNAFQTPAYTYGALGSNSAYAKAGEWSWLVISIRGTTGVSEEKNAWFNLATGQIGTVSAGATASIKPEANGYYRCTITATVTAGGSTSRIRTYPTNADNTYSTGNGSSGIYVWGAQAENGAVTPYQCITDWTSEAYASSGSTYFATPVGMSALHNQSMGATYNLPALSSDIYGWAITPERLSAVQESRLSRYFERLAGIAGPDYLTDDTGDILTADDGSLKLLAQ